MVASAVREDRYGLPLSTESDEVARLYREGQERTLAHAADPGELFERAVVIDPNFALAHAALALSRLREMRMAEAKVSAEKGLRLSTTATGREQQHVQAVADAVGGRGMVALDRIREHIAEFPADALLLNYSVTSLLFAGRQDEMLQMTELAGPGYASDDWFYLGLHAFALEEVRRFEEAKRAALLSLDRYPLAAFTTHAIAHVYYETGNFGEGASFMPDWLAGYDRRGGMHLHLSWHLALFLLARGLYGRVFELYETRIAPAAQPGPNPSQLYDPVSLLWRTDAYGGGSRTEAWSELGAIADERSLTPGMIFADLHHGMAAAAAGRSEAVERVLASFRARGARGNSVAGEVALPLLQGMVAFRAGDYEQTVRLIEPIEARIYQVGGSKAQREVFHDTLLEALLRSGRFAAAEARLRERLDRRPAPRDFYRLGQARAEAGDAAGADDLLGRALDGWLEADDDAPEPPVARRLRTNVAGG
jgi:tetratricopeptide (TPR) repeat protein